MKTWIHCSRKSRSILQQLSSHYRQPFKVTPFALLSIGWQTGILESHPYILSNLDVYVRVSKGCLGNMRLFWRNYLSRGSLQETKTGKSVQSHPILRYRVGSPVSGHLTFKYNYRFNCEESRYTIHREAKSNDNRIWPYGNGFCVAQSMWIFLQSFKMYVVAGYRTRSPVFGRDSSIKEND